MRSVAATQLSAASATSSAAFVLVTGFVVLVSLLVAATADAGQRKYDRHRPAYYANNSAVVYARVTDVRPLVEQVEVRVPVEECYESTAYSAPAYASPRPRSAVGGTIAGGVIGGVIGDRFGGGEGRDAMRLLGALVGAAVGHDAAARRQSAYYAPAAAQAYPVTQCTTRYESRLEQRTRGYQVRYLYEGREYFTETATPPGNRIPVEVSVRPAF